MLTDERLAQAEEIAEYLGHTNGQFTGGKRWMTFKDGADTVRELVAELRCLRDLAGASKKLKKQMDRGLVNADVNEQFMRAVESWTTAATRPSEL